MRHKVHHLQSRAQFQILLNQPALARTRHFVLYAIPIASMSPQESIYRQKKLPLQSSKVLELAAPNDEMGFLMVGALLPKRWARRAVTRNLLRRQTYAVALGLWQEKQYSVELSNYAFLVRLRAGLHMPKKAGSSAPKVSSRQGQIAPPFFRSAASEALRCYTRSQLMQLFECGLTRLAEVRPVTNVQIPLHTKGGYA